MADFLDVSGSRDRWSCCRCRQYAEVNPLNASRDGVLFGERQRVVKLLLWPACEINEVIIGNVVEAGAKIQPYRWRSKPACRFQLAPGGVHCCVHLQLFCANYPHRHEANFGTSVCVAGPRDALFSIAAIWATDCEVDAVCLDVGLGPFDPVPGRIHVSVFERFGPLATNFARKLDRLIHSMIASGTTSDREILQRNVQLPTG